jgi:threonine aldolase
MSTPLLPLDLRSDTLTQPSPQMRIAMANAIVGDDVFKEDPTIIELQKRCAALVGMTDALFVPSGTMANLIAILSHCQKGDDVVVGRWAHSFLYESGGGGALANVQFQILGDNGFFDAQQLALAIQDEDLSGHLAPTKLVMIENTHNRSGGRIWDPKAVQEISALIKPKGIALHIDGARLLNACMAKSLAATAWTQFADSVSFCFSKGLGAPVGSVLCGSSDFIKKAHRYRKMLGGGMRQSGILAAAALYALEHHLEDLKDDHDKAKRLAQALMANDEIILDLSQVQTNILLFSHRHLAPKALCEQFAPMMKILPFGPTQVRAVLHRDISDEAFEACLEMIADFKRK